MNSKKLLTILTITAFVMTGCSSSKKRNQHISTTDAVVSSEMRQEVPMNVYYELNKFDLSKSALEIISAQAEFIAKNKPEKITIQGHADERGTQEYNLALGNKRALSHKKVLVEHIKKNGVKINGNAVKVVSFGKTQPVVTNADSESEHAQNRRSVVVFE
jgi:peptidoglycan-associated lipoprotein